MPKTINLKTGKLVTKKPLVKPIKQSIKFVTEPKDTVKMRCQTDLENIIEVTEQNEPNPIDRAETKEITTEHDVLEMQGTVSSKGFMTKYLACVRTICNKLVFKKSSQEIDVHESKFVQMIDKIRKKKMMPILQPQKQPKRVLVLDLDETLIHTSFSLPDKYDFQSEIQHNGNLVKVYTTRRFGLQSFLFEMSRHYEIIIFTASQKAYADKIIDMIDPKKRVSYRLYREHCLVINKKYYLKNLNILGRNISEVLFVDDNMFAEILFPNNFYAIEPFLGNPKDRQLCRLSAFLRYLFNKASILPVIKHREAFEDMEIKLAYDQIKPRTLNQRKRQYNHRKTNSQVESLSEKTQTTESSETNVDESAHQLRKKL